MLEAWNVQNDNSIDKSLRHYSADKAVTNNYYRIVHHMICSDDPATIGVPKKGKYAGCFGAHVTKSVVLIYRIDYASHRIDLLNLGDHKMVYGSGG